VAFFLQQSTGNRRIELRTSVCVYKRNLISKEEGKQQQKEEEEKE
jgi:hypothetical protein